ncbi:glycoside hydrolase family 16 protein [Spirilliplanes yamanashiensis]|uniref:GH16 domain-containing protein n=1 Tax=Spirilliplanes yamanashiensis TaxID=42233 RepID=A0A8J4DHW5_9ACTN|nr:glycoside hydrolase family 16 protein [Spirilliplanes yamanashiensis]MDP9819363.1 hypothetical protein [Spirilliplanes yamanashiensis]GIJ01814.1 hypothetical protein Sya03_11660 [Spirilliplanes yamanashiensis]
MSTGPASDLDERFTGDGLDPAVWFPAYLPHWSSRAAAAATWTAGGGELRLSIPPEQGLWCADTHDGPLRASCVQTAHLDGQQPFREGLTVRESTPAFRGYTPRYGHVEARLRGEISPRSMVAFWLPGVEETPEQSAEICVMEVFGDAVRPGSADVGIGLHRFRDPALTEQWSAEPLPIDVAEFHTYAVDWRPGSLTFSVDGAVVREVGQAPDYPVQLVLGVFDFPDRPGPAGHVPALVVSHVRGYAL